MKISILYMALTFLLSIFNAQEVFAMKEACKKNARVNTYKGKGYSFNKSHYMLIMKNGKERRTFKNNRIADNTTGGPVYFLKA